MDVNCHFHATAALPLGKAPPPHPPGIHLTGAARTAVSVSTIDRGEKSRVPAGNLITN